MPAYDLSDLRALVLRHLRVGNTVKYSPTKGSADYDWIDDELKKGQEEFAKLTKCLRTYAIIQLKNAHRTYKAPSDFIDLEAAYYYHTSLSDGYKELVIGTIAELNDDVSDWRTDTGTPSRIYTDRTHGGGTIFGVYPIPDADGDAIAFSSTYASEIEWVCPLYVGYQDYARIIRYAQEPTWIVSTDNNVSVDPEVSNGNILIEYARRPYQIAELPADFAKSPALWAAGSLLANNPEDSAEYKRSITLFGMFDRDVAAYVAKRKRNAHVGKELRARAAVHGWQQQMPYYTELP